MWRGETRFKKFGDYKVMVQVLIPPSLKLWTSVGGGCDGGCKMVFGSHSSPIHEPHDVPQITMAYSRKIIHCRIGFKLAKIVLWSILEVSNKV